MIEAEGEGPSVLDQVHTNRFVTWTPFISFWNPSCSFEIKNPPFQKFIHFINTRLCVHIHEQVLASIVARTPYPILEHLAQSWKEADKKSEVPDEKFTDAMFDPRCGLTGQTTEGARAAQTLRAGINHADEMAGLDDEIDEAEWAATAMLEQQDEEDALAAKRERKQQRRARREARKERGWLLFKSCYFHCFWCNCS